MSAKPPLLIDSSTIVFKHLTMYIKLNSGYYRNRFSRKKHYIPKQELPLAALGYCRPVALQKPHSQLFERLEHLHFGL